MKNRILSAVLSLCLCLGLAVPAWAAGSAFPDVPSSHWSHSYVERAAEKGWVSGTGNGLYEPNKKVTVAEWYAMVTRAAYPNYFKDTGVNKSMWYGNEWYGLYVAVGERVFLDNRLPESIANPENINRPITRAEMACTVAVILSGKGYTATAAELESVKSKMPDYATLTKDTNGKSYYTGAATVYHFNIISGVDNSGRFDGFASMDRAQAATVLCRLMELIGGQSKPTTHDVVPTPGPVPDIQPDVKPDIQPDTKPDAQPKPKPEQPSGNYGPVGTVSDSPVTLSYETHKPVTDYWAQNSEEFKAKVDRDTYNAAVQSLKDWDIAGDINGKIGRAKANIYYNYAVFDKGQGEYCRRTVLSIANSGLLADLSLGDFITNKTSIWTTFSQIEKIPGFGNYKSYIDQITPSMSDKEVAELCMKAMTDNWTYGVGSGSWGNGQFVGKCGELAIAYQQVMRAAGIPCIRTGSSKANHDWTYVKLDGTWYFADPTLAVRASDVGNDVFDAVWLSEMDDPMNNSLFEGTTGIKLFDEGSGANIAMHAIEQAGYGR